MLDVVGSLSAADLATILHCTVIAACFVISRVYFKRTYFFAVQLRWWSYSLIVVFALYVNRLIAGNEIAVAPGPLLAEALLSNVSNILVLKIAFPRWRDFAKFAGIAALVPLLGWWLGPTIFSSLWLRAVSIKLPSALFSFVALLFVGIAMARSINAMRRVVFATFLIYALYQIPLGFLVGPMAFYDYSLPNLEAVYRTGALLLKYGCTMLLVATAAELAREGQTKDMLRLFGDWRLKSGNEDQVLVLIKSSEATLKTTVYESLRHHELEPVVFVDTPDEPPDLISIVQASLNCRRAVIVLDGRPSQSFALAMENFMSYRKECLIVTSLPTEDYAPRYFFVRRYQNVSTLPAIIAEWIAIAEFPRQRWLLLLPGVRFVRSRLPSR